MSYTAKGEASYAERSKSRSRSTITVVNYAESVKLTVEKDSKLAWLACFCAIVDQIFICGLLQIFGVFFVEFVRDFKSTRAEAAWLGSLAFGTMKLFGPVTGAFVIRFNNRAALILGCCLCSISTLVSSFIYSMSILYVTYSLLYGVGASLVINCVMVLANAYFDKHLGLATGLVCAGSSVGTLILAPLSQHMIDTVGWRMAFRVFSAVFILVGVLNCFVQPIRKKKEKDYEPEKTLSNEETEVSTKDKVEKSTSWTLMKNRAFILWVLAITLSMFGYFIPFVHLVSYGVSIGITTTKCTYFIMALGGATTIGRLVSGRIVQSGYLNSLHLIQFCMIVTGVLYMIMPAVTNFVAIIPFVTCLGLIDGCYVVMLPIITCSLVGYSDAILAWGMLAGVGSVAFTSGPPAAGALFDHYGNYDIAFHVAGVPVICGSLLLFFIPWARRTSPSTTADLKVLESDEHVSDSGKGSDEQLQDDPSEETLHFDSVKEVNPDVQHYLDSHLNRKFDPTTSTSLSEYNVMRSNPIDMQSESLPVTFALVCGPDGMPISVPSSILVPRSSKSTTKSATTRFSGSSQPRAKTPKYVDAGTQFADGRDSVSDSCMESQSMQQSGWSFGRTATPMSDANTQFDNRNVEQKSACVQTGESVKSGFVSVNNSVRDGEDQDVFQNIFKDTSDTKL